MMKSLLIAAALGIGAIASTELIIADLQAVEYSKKEARVTGKGSSLSEAYEDARDNLPTGKSHHRKEQRQKPDGTWIVTLYYYE